MEYLGLLRGITNLGSDEGRNVYLKALNEHQSFQSAGSSKEIDETVQIITSLLVKHDSRLTGLLLLKHFVQQCSIEVLEQKGGIWTTQILKACNHSDQKLAYEVLASVAEKSQSLSSFSTNYLPKVYESLANATGDGLLPAVRCAELCLRLYAGPSAPSRGLIEKFVSRFIDTPSEPLGYAIGRCQLLLQQVRGGSVHGMSQKALWESLQLKLIGSLHSVLDSAFEKCTELYDASAVQKEQLDVPAIDLSDEPLTRAGQLYTRFRNLTSYLIVALCDTFPVEKAIKPKRILDLIARGLGVNSPALQRTSISDNIALAALLPQFHLHLLQLLQALMLTLGSHFKMYHVTILNLLTESLKITSSKNSIGVTKPLINLRNKAYDLITLWCHNMGNGSRCEMHIDFFVEQIMFDIYPFQTEFTLQVLSGARKHMSKKARRQLHKAQNEQSNLSQTFSNTNMRKENLSDEGNQSLCAEALTCLCALLQSSSYHIKPTTLKVLHIKLLEISSTFYEMPMKRQLLYADWRCRMEIYNVLFKFVEVPHHLCPPPTQLICNILQSAHVRDNSMAVRKRVGVILQSMEKIVHPCKEGLLFPINLRHVRNALKDFAPEDVFVRTSTADNEDSDELSSDAEDGQANNNTTQQSPLSEPTNKPEITPHLNSNNQGDANDNMLVDEAQSDEDSDDEIPSDEPITAKTTLDGKNKQLTNITDKDLEPHNAQDNSHEPLLNIPPVQTHKRTNEIDAAESVLTAPKKISKLSDDCDSSQEFISIDKEHNSNDGDNDLLFADIEASFVDELK